MRAQIASLLLVIACGGAEPPARTAAPRTYAPPLGTWRDECLERYVSKLERFAVCDEVPADERELARKDAARARSAFEELAQHSLEAQRTAAEACRQSAETLALTATSMGCTL